VTEISFSTLRELSQSLGRGDMSATELAGYFLERIRRLDPRLNAYVRADEEPVMQQAQAADCRRRAGYVLGPLDGVPIAVKDLFEIEGQLTGAGSAAFADRRSTITATAVRRLLGAGMVVLGKTQMVEFAFGGWGTNPRLGTPVNPWDPEIARIPGGSSSGSGVAVAAGLAPAALGSDTGGSVRIPASLTGITGLKTTTGLISLYGAFPLSGTLDSIGPMTRDALDAGLLTQVLSGEDANDPRTRGVPAFCAAGESDPDLRGTRISVLPVESFPIQVSDGVLRAYREFQALLRELGAIVEEVPFPFDFHDLMLRNGSLIAAEAFAIHRSYIDDESLAFGPHVRRRIQAGRAISAADYIDALAHHHQQRGIWSEWMQSRDALLTPTLPMAAAPVDSVDEAATPLAAFTRAANYLGACGISLPGGFDAGLPIGMQLLAGPYKEHKILGIAAAVQARSDWHRRQPPLS
jgi:aspartyl-tRNA(Asn)/glutamyl-tRNA(Gln) amidotransferase subunit A